MPRPVVLIAEELSPATIEVLGTDIEVRHVDGTDRDALLEFVPEDDPEVLHREADTLRTLITAGEELAR